MQRQFLVVSENGKVRESLATAVRRRGCTVTLAATFDEAMMVVRNVDVDVVLLDCRHVDARTKRLRTRLAKARPGCKVILLSSFGSIRNSTELLQFDLEDYLLGSRELIDLLLAPQADGKADKEDDRGVRALTQVVDVLVGLVEMGDAHFSGSSHKAARLARMLAQELGVERETLDEVVIAAFLKDIGKVGVDESLLSSEGEYSDEQMAGMQEHIEGSIRLLEHVDFPWKVIPVIRHHHERYDGKGYPDGLKGREIPVGARIVAAVDAWVAMTSDRPHREAMEPARASEELESQAGRQFDPEVVEALLRILERGQAGLGKGESPRVLIVDGDEAFRKHLQMRLRNEGFDAEAVDGVDAALTRLLDEAPNLILASVGTGENDAFQLLRELRTDKELRGIPFAFLADSDDRILRIRALRQGVDDFMSKTGDLEELAARVENILTREASRRDDGAPSRRRGITGQLENLGLPDIVQTLVIGMKTARVELATDHGKGRIWFREGALVHARTGELEGEDAFIEMVRWTDGEFVIEHGVRIRSTTIESDAMFLIMEGMRRLDEESAGKPGPA